MDSIIQVGEVPITVTLKDVRNVHLSVHPPDGRVTLVAPVGWMLPVPMPLASQAGFATGSSNSSTKSERHPVNSLDGKATISGDDVICYLSSTRTLSPALPSTINASPSLSAQVAMPASEQKYSINGTSLCSMRQFHHCSRNGRLRWVLKQQSIFYSG